MTVSELGRRMSSPEFVEWVAFYRIERQIKTDTLPPLEFDNPAEQDAAIDAIFARFGK